MPDTTFNPDNPAEFFSHVDSLPRHSQWDAVKAAFDEHGKALTSTKSFVRWIIDNPELFK